MITAQLATVCSVLTMIVCYTLYFRGIWQGALKPHLFSWLVWSLSLGITAAAQLDQQGGLGAWLTIIAVMNGVIALVSLRYGETKITKGDWISLLTALAAIPLWLVTQTPLYSVILICVIDTVAYYPTVRKSWAKPWEEQVTMFALSVINGIFMTLALENKNLITALYPAIMVLANGLLVAMLLYRRRLLPKFDVKGAVTP
jgi:hypothetical protein